MADIVARFNEFQSALESSNPWLWWLGAAVVALVIAFVVRLLILAALRRTARRLSRQHSAVVVSPAATLADTDAATSAGLDGSSN